MKDSDLHGLISHMYTPNIAQCEQLSLSMVSMSVCHEVSLANLNLFCVLHGNARASPARIEEGLAVSIFTEDNKQVRCFLFTTYM